MTFRAPKGTDDILPPASRQWRRLLLSWEDWSARFGYDLMLVPLFEATEVFARGVGETSEVVQKQMYTFVDKAGRSLTLRPEGTAGVVRAYLQSGGSGVWKVAYSGYMFRYEQPQAGRRRQFYQVGVEYIGEPAPEADVEVVELGYRYITDVGLTDLVVAVNSIGDETCRPAYMAELQAYLRDRRDDLCTDSRPLIETNPMRVLDCKVCSPVLADAPVPGDFLCDDCRRHHDHVLDQLTAVGVPYQEAPRLVRGLDYYTRTAFEYLATGLDAAQNAVGGGGRYDGLAEVLGGDPTPGIGFALGIDRIVLALGEGDDRPPLDVFVVVADEERRGDAQVFVSRLRRAGVRVDLDPGRRSVRAQFRAADRRGAANAVVIGAEWADGKVTGRRMATGEQELIEIEEVGSWATSR